MMSAVCVVVCTVLGVLASSIGSLAGEADPASSARADAEAYLRSLPADTDIYIWPTRSRPYEILANDATEISKSIGRYNSSRGDYNGLHPARRIAQISIISVAKSVWKTSRESVASRSKLLTYYRDFALNEKYNENGCTAFKFTDRDTWAAVGIVAVDTDHFNENSILDKCIHGALDYIQGVPISSSGFNYLQFPDEDTSKIILSSIYHCASDGKSSASTIERTKDGLMPLPLMDCVLEESFR